jgi:hypothetical protein
VPFGSAIRPVRELIEYLLSGRMPADLSQALGSLAGSGVARPHALSVEHVQA